MVLNFQDPDPDPLARCMDPDLLYCYVLTFSPNPAPEKKDQKEVTVCIHKRYRTILTTFSHSDADPDLKPNLSNIFGFGLPGSGSGSISQMYGSGSTVLLCSYVLSTSFV
jgi:hypothetical protein